MTSDHDDINAFRWTVFALVVGICLLICGCGPSKRDQAIADSAATIWEAAEAQKQGVPVGITADAIQQNASGICDAVGIPYPPKKPEKTP